MEFANSDFIFDGSMEGDFDRALPPFAELMNGMTAAGILIKSPKPHFSKSVVVKTERDRAGSREGRRRTSASS